METKIRRIAIIKCAGYTYPYYMLQLLKLFCVYLTTLNIAKSIYIATAYLLVLMFFMFRERYNVKKYADKIILKFPKFSDKGLEIIVQPVISPKPFIANIILHTIVIFSLVLATGETKINIEYIGASFAFFIFYLLILLFEYAGTVHCKTDIIAKPIVVEELEYNDGKYPSKRTDLYEEYKELIDEIHEHNLGIIPLNPEIDDDLKFVQLNSKLETYNSRFENLTIESIFVTGLAISGFFTVFNTSSYDQIKSTFISVKENISINPIDIEGDISNHFNLSQMQFFMIVSVLSILCSIFYLLALMMRIRINHLYNMSKENLNQIEVLNNFMISIDTQVELSKKAQLKKNFLVETTENLLKSLSDTAEIISVYRIMGLFVFYCIIVISAFQINFGFGIGVLIFSLMTHFIKKLEEIVKTLNLRHRI